MASVLVSMGKNSEKYFGSFVGIDGALIFMQLELLFSLVALYARPSPCALLAAMRPHAEKV